MTKAELRSVRRYRLSALLGVSVALLVRVPIAYLALANSIPVMILNGLLALIPAVAALHLWLPGVFRLRARASIVLLTVTAAIAVPIGLLVEGLILYPHLIVVDAWMGLLLSSGLVIAVTTGALTAGAPGAVQGVGVLLAVAASGALFHRAVGPPIAGWLAPMAVTGTLLLVVALFGRLADIKERAYQSERERAALSARLAAASAEILDSRHREALSLVASGIAHEINNPMTYLRGNLELLREELTDCSAAHAPGGRLPAGIDELIDAMTGGMDSITAVVSRIRNVFKDGSGSAEAVRLHDVVRSAAASLPPEVLGNVSVRNTVDPSLAVTAHPADVYIIARNLISNAVDACHQTDEPRVVIRSERLGRATRLVVQDNGRGMNTEQVRDCFDPFFTTKANGAGMGVGLALCKAIAERTGSRIEIDSELGRGTTVTYEILEAP